MLNHRFQRSVTILGIGLLFGCASTEEMMQTDADPLEPYNRFMFRVNDTLDKAVLKPAAQGYDYLTPNVVNRSVTNFFNNLGDVIVIVNDLLQLKLQQTVMDTSRLVFNTTVGLAGLFDVASHMDLPKHDEDFGQTLGYWGVGEGYYLVLPFFGPSTTRDVWRLPADYLVDPVTYVDPTGARYALRGVDVVDTRADLLQAERAFAEGQVDPYSFQRQTYLQYRRNLVYDGNPPKPKFEFEDSEASGTPDQSAAPKTP